MLGTPGFTCSDEDSANGPEPLSYSIQSSVYSSYFRINASGVVSYAQDYDVDSGSLPMTLTLNVDCTDDEGATDTAELIITINVIAFLSLIFTLQNEFGGPLKAFFLWNIGLLILFLFMVYRHIYYLVYSTEACFFSI